MGALQLQRGQKAKTMAASGTSLGKIESSPSSELLGFPTLDTHGVNHGTPIQQPE